MQTRLVYNFLTFLITLTCVSISSASITLIDNENTHIDIDAMIGAFLTNLGGKSPSKSQGTTTPSTNGVVFKQEANLSGNTSSLAESRIRTGFIPNGLGINFNFKEFNWSPKARFSITTAIQADKNKAQTGPSIDWREAFVDFTSQDYGKITVGRALGLFLNQQYLYDYERLSTGSAPNGGDFTTIGRVGMGYLFTNFNAQITYTTPNIDGFLFSIGLFDPSKIIGEAANNASSAIITRSPRLEMNAHYTLNRNYGYLVDFFINGLTQRAGFDDNAKATVVESGSINAWGIGYGIKFESQFYNLIAAGYNGSALGTKNIFTDGNALDRIGKARKCSGFYAQFIKTYNDNIKSGVAIGSSRQKQTPNDKDNFNNDLLKQRSMNTSLFYSWNKLAVSSIGITLANTKYMQGKSQTNYQINVGIVFEI